MTVYHHVEVESPVRRGLRVLVPVAVGAVVAVSLGVYGRTHTPAGVAVTLTGLASTLTVKVWLASVVAVFALLQVVSALVLYGRLPPAPAPDWIAPAHRWSGRVAFLLSIPVAVHCLYALGFETSSPRVLLHSLFGCVFFGVFTAKMLLLTRKGLAGWVLPIAGGLAFALLIGLWLTSALWFLAGA
jgi:hypothetical protein